MENSMSRNKKRRRNVDRISVLPEALLLHILSFLPIKEAVATSLLSKKWRPLWRSLPVLDFNRKNFRNLPSFQLFVDKVLNSVDLKSVKKFVLNFSSYKPSAKASEWINAVIRNKVEHLELRLRWPYEFPSNVLIANTMRVLKLNGVTVATLSHVNLPLLEVLHLEDVKCPVFASLEMLLNACPLLEDLAVRFPYGVDYEPLNIGRLQHLVTAEVPQSLIPLEALSNATILRFIHEGKWPSTFSDDMPMFNNVIHLECVADEWTRMVNCLHSFPKLDKLVISELDSPPPAEPILEVPSCVALHLKEFTLCFFGGSESESEMVKFMVENGGVLRTVYICADSDEYKIRKCKNLAAYLRSGTESCSQMHEQPLVFMIS